MPPLVIVPKKNREWKFCVEYKELNKCTLKNNFPLHFIDQFLDTFAGKKFFSFLNGFSGYNQIQIAPKDEDKTTFTHGEPLPTDYSPFGFAMHLLLFSR